MWLGQEGRAPKKGKKKEEKLAKKEQSESVA